MVKSPATGTGLLETTGLLHSGDDDGGQSGLKLVGFIFVGATIAVMVATTTVVMKSYTDDVCA